MSFLPPDCRSAFFQAQETHFAGSLGVDSNVFGQCVVGAIQNALCREVVRFNVKTSHPEATQTHDVFRRHSRRGIHV